MGTTLHIHVRSATIDDLPDVARLNVAAWQDTYAGQVPQSYLDSLNVPDRLEKWQEIFAGKTSEDNNLEIAFFENEPVGFISYGRGRDQGLENYGEIYAVYLLKEVWGRSVGYSLFQAAREKLVQAGFSQAYLWVLATNHQAVNAYEKWGGIADPLSTKKIVIHDKIIQEIIVKFPQL